MPMCGPDEVTDLDSSPDCHIHLFSAAFNDQASGVAVDTSGNIFLVGPAVGFMETAIQDLGNGDGFVLKVSSAGVLQ